MRSFTAALRSLTLPYGATSGPRIVLDGINGLIDVFNATREVLRIDSAGLHVTGTQSQIDLAVDADGTQSRILFSDPTGANTPARINVQPSLTGAEGIEVDSGQDPGGFFSRIVNLSQNAFWETNVPGGGGSSILLQGDHIDVVTALVARNEVYQNVTLLAGWVNRGAAFDNCAFKRDANGRVWLRGTISGGTSTPGTKIGNIPAGYRPTGKDVVMAIASDTLPAAYAASNGPPRLQVQPTGDMFIYGTGTGPLWFACSWDTRN